MAQQVKSTLATANTALTGAVLSTAVQSLTSTAQAQARSNIGALGASDVGAGIQSISVAGNTDVTLTATQAAAQFITLTGTLTGNINVIVPTAARLFFIYNNTSGAYTLTVKTASGTGVAVPQGGRGMLAADGTNVVRPETYELGPEVVAGTLTVTGTATLSGGVSVSGGATVAGGLSLDAVSGAAVAALADVLAGTAGNKIVPPSVLSSYLGTILGSTTAINNIGTPGYPGFGVGICPLNLPAGLLPMAGHAMPGSDSYGNYQYSDGSVIVWVPAFYYKWGTGSNGLSVNQVSIQPFSAYGSVSAANSAGYALHRAFYDGGAVKQGFFVDKYQCCNNGGKASSLKNGVPIVSGQRGSLSSAVFSALTGAPPNNYGGAIAAAKTRGTGFFCASVFINKALAMLSYAHAQGATGTQFCAWYDSSGVNNFPKGDNNNALGDTNDGSIYYTSDNNGTYNCGLTGSANLFARTTHNGQNCGVADLNGNVWEITPGISSDGTNFYLLNTSATMASLTGSNSASTDLWGSSGLSTNYTSLGATVAALTASSSQKTMGSSSQVFDASLTGSAWGLTGAGVPLSGGAGGSNAFGNDGLWDYRPNEMCPISGGAWFDGSAAGVWALFLRNARGDSGSYVGFRAALYL